MCHGARLLVFCISCSGDCKDEVLRIGYGHDPSEMNREDSFCLIISVAVGGLCFCSSGAIAVSLPLLYMQSSYMSICTLELPFLIRSTAILQNIMFHGSSLMLTQYYFKNSSLYTCCQLGLSIPFQQKIFDLTPVDILFVDNNPAGCKHNTILKF